MKAIHLLNSAYLGRGEEFLTTCMDHLTRAGSCDDNLVTCHRALLLLKSHLETFRKKYAYQFRYKKRIFRFLTVFDFCTCVIYNSVTFYPHFTRRLSIEGKPVSSHADLVEVRHSSLIRINVQPGGAICEKVTFDMHTSDLVADLRAEISVWWETKMTGRVTTNNMNY